MERKEIGNFEFPWLNLDGLRGQFVNGIVRPTSLLEANFLPPVPVGQLPKVDRRSWIPTTSPQVVIISDPDDDKRVDAFIQMSEYFRRLIEIDAGRHRAKSFFIETPDSIFNLLPVSRSSRRIDSPDRINGQTTSLPMAALYFSDYQEYQDNRESLIRKSIVTFHEMSLTTRK